MKYLLVLLFALPFTLAAQKNQFSIRGAVKGLADKSVIYLTDPDNPGDTIARAVSGKGSFTLKGKLADTKLYHITFGSTGKKSLLFLENSAVKLEADMDDLQQIRVSGSPAHASFVAFQKEFDPYFKRYMQLSEIAGKSGVNDSLLTVYRALVKEIAEAADKFGAENRDKQVAPFMWASLMQLVDDLDRVEKSFNAMSPEVQSGFYGKFLAGRIAETKIGRIGSQALDFQQADTSGLPVSLSSFRGKYVLVDFWASWCGPCRQENPNVVRAFEKFREKNFTILGVSLDNNRSRWIKAIADDRLNWTQVSDLKYWQNEVAVKYKIQSIPQNLLIDPNGVIIAKNLRGEQLQEKLCELLGCD